MSAKSLFPNKVTFTGARASAYTSGEHNSTYRWGHGKNTEPEAEEESPRQGPDVLVVQSGVALKCSD